MSEDFSNGKSGSIITADPNKVRITIRLDGDVIEYFRSKVHSAGGGNYQTLINEALRDHISEHDLSLDRYIKNSWTPTKLQLRLSGR